MSFLSLGVCVKSRGTKLLVHELVRVQTLCTRGDKLPVFHACAKMCIFLTFRWSVGD